MEFWRKKSSRDLWKRRGRLKTYFAFSKGLPRIFKNAQSVFKTSWAFLKIVLRSHRRPPSKTPPAFPYRFCYVSVRPVTLENVPSVFLRFQYVFHPRCKKTLWTFPKRFRKRFKNHSLEQPTFPKRFRRGMKKDLLNCPTFPKRFRRGLEKYLLIQPTFPKRFFYVFVLFPTSPRKRRKHVFSVFVFLPATFSNVFNTFPVPPGEKRRTDGNVSNTFFLFSVHQARTQNVSGNALGVLAVH